MADPVDLEIGLRWQPVGQVFDVDVRYSDPLGEADKHRASKRPLQLDPSKLLVLVADEEAYSALLSQSLFEVPEVGASFAEARELAETDSRPVRVRLRIDRRAPGQFHALRWETLRDPSNGRPIATNGSILFSRYLSDADWRPIRLRPKRELHTLIVIANPADLGDFAPKGRRLAPIDADEELERARHAVGGSSVTELASPGRATLSGITAELERGGYDILYLVCHSGVTDDVPFVFLEKEDGTAGLVDARRLAESVRDLDQPPAMAVLSGPMSAGSGGELSSSDDGIMALLGVRLVEAGIAAVVAMQDNITKRTIEVFMPSFFAELASEGVVDLAMTKARLAVADRADWWVPVLFTRLRTGRIWDSPAAAASWVAPPGNGGRQSSQIAGYSADSVAEEDQLNIVGDVRALAAVLASNRTTPPVSVGLFGDWGWGKSFFMHQLQLRIHELAAQSRYAENAKPPEVSFFCSEVVQIDFNAWHYVDANLWASLVTRIFEGLSEHVERQKGTSEAYQTLFAELETARVLLNLCVPITSSTSCDQVIFVDHASDVGLSSDAV